MGPRENYERIIAENLPSDISDWVFERLRIASIVCPESDRSAGIPVASVVEIRPDDIALQVCFPGRLSPEAAERVCHSLRTKLAPRLPADMEIVILDEGAELKPVRRMPETPMAAKIAERETRHV